MSNYHYDDRSGCANCSYSSKYSPINELDTYKRGPKCIDRFNTQRSEKDKMYYNYFVLNKPLHLQPLNKTDWKK